MSVCLINQLFFEIFLPVDTEPSGRDQSLSLEKTDCMNRIDLTCANCIGDHKKCQIFSLTTASLILHKERVFLIIFKYLLIIFTCTQRHVSRLPIYCGNTTQCKQIWAFNRTANIERETVGNLSFLCIVIKYWCFPFSFGEKKNKLRETLSRLDAISVKIWTIAVKSLEPSLACNRRPVKDKQFDWHGLIPTL